MVVFAGECNAGLKRASNQDCIGIDPQTGLVVVADGVGGYKGGELASRLAVQTVCAAVERRLRSDGPEADLEDVLRAALDLAGKRIADHAAEDENRADMASTIVVALCTERQVCLAHLGDSRAYLIRPPSDIARLTVDHSIAQEMVQGGRLTEQDARTHKLRHVVTHCLGAGGATEPTTTVLAVTDSDTLLLCSDGLTNVLADSEILEVVLQFGDRIDATCRRLVDLVNRRGGTDNVSVVIARFGGTSWQP